MSDGGPAIYLHQLGCDKEGSAADGAPIRQHTWDVDPLQVLQTLIHSHLLLSGILSHGIRGQAHCCVDSIHTAPRQSAT